MTVSSMLKNEWTNYYVLDPMNETERLLSMEFTFRTRQIVTT